MSTSVTFSKYGKAFQETLAHLILEDRPFADQMNEVLDINFFELKYLRVFVDKVFDYKKKYDVQPSKKVISTILRVDLEQENDAVQRQVRDYFARICVNKISDVDYVKETALDFCKKQKLKEAMVKSV